MQAHERNAKRLLNLFKKQGGIYVKAGQHMSSLTYVLPPQYCYVMRELHNKVSTALHDDYFNDNSPRPRTKNTMSLNARS